ncbi:MAG TPA: hypothetical protein VGX51_04800 [Solirubrobacteraceae bacterium]|jgi:hypothetical protein|nr:hypothetical protein [Solirubrobacteraceae bacterium]
MQSGSMRERRPATPPPPLGADERPPALLVAVAVCAALAVAVVIGAATVHHLSRHGGSLPGALFIAAVLAALAWGMYQRRYWAVLGFEALLAFQIIVTSLALVVASGWVAAVVCVASVALGGWLFWKLVRVLGRVAAGDRLQRPER